MLEENDKHDLHIDVSIDWLPELHYDIACNGLFNRAIESYQGCASWKSTIQFCTCIQVTVSLNQHQCRTV
jgi:hypothetical protein